MDFKKIFLENNTRKLAFLGLFLVSFGAGFGLAFLQGGRQATGFFNNDTPKALSGQYGNPTAVDSDGDGIPDEPVNPVTNTPTPNPTSNSGVSCLFKGKPTKAGKKIYYYPGSLFYAKVKNPQCFQNEADAQAAGFKRSAH